MARYIVQATLQGIGPIPCGRPYPREDHCDAFGYSSKTDAEMFAARLRAQFPENTYSVKES